MNVRGINTTGEQSALRFTRIWMGAREGGAQDNVSLLALDRRIPEAMFGGEIVTWPVADGGGGPTFFGRRRDRTQRRRFEARPPPGARVITTHLPVRLLRGEKRDDSIVHLRVAENAAMSESVGGFERSCPGARDRLAIGERNLAIAAIVKNERFDRRSRTERFDADVFGGYADTSFHQLDETCARLVGKAHKRREATERRVDVGRSGDQNCALGAKALA